MTWGRGYVSWPPADKNTSTSFFCNYNQGGSRIWNCQWHIRSDYFFPANVNGLTDDVYASQAPSSCIFFFFFYSFFNITFLTILFRLWSTSTTISPVWALSICYFVLFLVSCELSNLYLLFIDCEWHCDWRKGWEKETSSRYAFHLILFINNY